MHEPVSTDLPVDVVHPVAAADDPEEHEEVERHVEEPPSTVGGPDAAGTQRGAQGQAFGGEPL